MGADDPMTPTEPRTVRQRLATSDARAIRFLRGIRRRVNTVALPVPRVVAWPMLQAFLIGRAIWHWVFRVFVCEPLFKAQCREYGRRVRTDVYIHWIQGRGDIMLGDDVLVDGKCSISFAARYAARPRLVIGGHTGIGHGCAFSIGKQIAIGAHCRIAAGVWMFDSSGHALDPEARLAGVAPAAADVRPIAIGDNVWIGSRAIIHPGVTIGAHSVVSAGAIVMGDVPPYSLVAGNPARRVRSLTPAGGSPVAVRTDVTTEEVA